VAATCGIRLGVLGNSTRLDVVTLYLSMLLTRGGGLQVERGAARVESGSGPDVEALTVSRGSCGVGQSAGAVVNRVVAGREQRK
jgi:hypothetical protein